MQNLKNNTVFSCIVIMLLSFILVIICNNVTDLQNKTKQLNENYLQLEAITNVNNNIDMENMQRVESYISKTYKRQVEQEQLTKTLIDKQEKVVAVTSSLISSLKSAFVKPSYEYLKSVTVFIVGEIPVPEGEDPCQWCGTGVIVKQEGNFSWILTNAHVTGDEFPEGSNIKLSIKHNLKTIPAILLARADGSDLALILVMEKLEGKSTIKGRNVPLIAEKVYTCGQNLGRPYIYGEGVFSGVVRGEDVYQLPVMGGCSGSGIFNVKGELIGLVYLMRGSGQGFSVAWDTSRACAVNMVQIDTFLSAYGL